MDRQALRRIISDTRHSIEHSRTLIKSVHSSQDTLIRILNRSPDLCESSLAILEKIQIQSSDSPEGIGPTDH
jgi:hypothetical protein